MRVFPKLCYCAEDQRRKRKRYPEPQIVFALRQPEAGTPAAEICRKMGIVMLQQAARLAVGLVGGNVLPVEDEVCRPQGS
jgi:hypothetical protein